MPTPDELEVQKLLYQHQPSYLDRALEGYENWQQEHPYLNIAAEGLAATALPLEIAKRAPDAIRGVENVYDAYQSGELGKWRERAAANRQEFVYPQDAGTAVAEGRRPTDEELQKSINTSLAFLTPQQYRDPAKREFWEGYQKAQAKGEHGNYLFNKMYESKQVLNKVVENQGLNRGPYELTLYRGGRGQTAPGRGIYHTPDPSEAAIYENFRRTGKDLTTAEQMDHSLQRIDAKTVELKKPFVQRRAFYGEESLGEGASVTGEQKPYGHDEEVRDLIYNLNLSKTEAKTARKLNEAMWLKPQKVPDQPGAFPNEQNQLRYERYIMRLAKDRGYDSVVYHTPEMEHFEVALPDE